MSNGPSEFPLNIEGSTPAPSTPRDSRLEIPHIPETIKVRWAGDVALAETELTIVPSSLTLDSAARDAARAKFDETKAEGQSDTRRLRFEGATTDRAGHLVVLASEGITYGEHNFRRHFKGLEESKVIDPLTMYAVVEDINGDFVVAIWNQDQAGKYASVPVGFLDAPAEGALLRDFYEEIRLKFEQQIKLGHSDSEATLQNGTLESIRVRAVVSGTNQDTTMIMFAKCPGPAQDMSLLGGKYKEASVERIPAQAEVLHEILESGRFKGKEVNDLLLAAFAIKLKDLQLAGHASPREIKE